MFNKILVATDGSASSDKAVELAATLAKDTDVELIIVHVMQHGRATKNVRAMVETEHLVEQSKHHNTRLARSARGLIAVLGASDEAVDASHRVNQAYGDHLLAKSEYEAQQCGATRVSTIMEDGDPAECIVDRVGKEQADLLVAGSRGLGNVKGMLMGSVSHKLVQLAPCTCITVK